ncbi:MAG: T9SS type A sorting domain-containing protein [Bacteroidetes bacterium]|nr:T9SS type A sorting domain-containing protein [Bacteroidota bacterium]
MFKESIIRLFKIYPNPTEGEFQAEVNLSEDSDITLRLVSFGTGKTEAIRLLKGNHAYLESFNMTHVKPGIYLLNLQVKDEMRNLKVIIR